MIPLQLSLKNFLSYQEAQLNFRGLHVACICGANGAGKSSLLEAMVWAIWGESRAQTEDDVIHAGATEVLVDFQFQVQQQTYRILRSRHRGQVSILEFQVQIPSGFRSLTERGIRATQQLILQHLKLDYDTFINSAYLRQGRADEFMLKRPSDRKQILADLLKLDQYDALSEQAKEQSRQFKAEQALLERRLETIAHQLQQAPALESEQEQLSANLTQMQQQQVADLQNLRQLQQLQQQRQAWSEQQAIQQQQAQTLEQDCQRLAQEIRDAQQQQQQLEAVLQEAEAITQRYVQMQALQAEEEAQSGKFQRHQVLQAQLQQLQQQALQQQQKLREQLRQAETELGWLNQQQQEIQQTLGRASEIEAGLERLHQARSQLSQLDQLQMQVAPLMQRRQQLQSQLDRSQTRLTARLEELATIRQQLEAQQQQQPVIQQAAQAISAQISEIERRQFYQQQVREKGIERRTFMERLQEQQRKCEREMAELDQKLLLLQQGRAGSAISVQAGAMALQVGQAVGQIGQALGQDSPSGQLSITSLRCAEPSYSTPATYPPCPLCNHPLDAHHWQVVIDHHQQEKQEIQDQLWVIREQLTTSDREIRVLRQEYRDLDKELAQYGAVLEQRGKLQEQLEGLIQNQERLQQVISEQTELHQALQQGDYATELHQELHLLEQTLSQLSYDDRNHALARGQVDRWRWAEVKSAELRQAQRKQAQLEQQQPQLLATIEQLKQQLADLQHSPLQQQIAQQERNLLELGYLPEQHLALRQQLKQAQVWQSRYQALQQARDYYPALQERIQALGELWASRHQMQQALWVQLQDLTQQLAQLSDPAAAIQALEQQMQMQRSQLDQGLAQLGRLQQQAQQLVELADQQAQFTIELVGIKHQVRIYQELAQAFGKNGIQALMIENVLPQLEAETNQTLGRLSANQLHVQFVTQRASRKASATKLIDTLDILISDMQGTRPYETYSGGETFRVNFAIRLALARLLAQRSGMALQMLIIDEGFGTQDEAGCDRLIGAINAIAADFACILTVTHIPHLKEAFQTRIEINKTEQGSQIRLSA